MKTLHRHLLKTNLFLMLICLGVGVVVYLLADVFDRLDDFLEAGLGLGMVLAYFGNKIPLILSQIMPAVFLIALVVQLSLMERNREMMALRTGGVSYGKLAMFFVCYALVWSVVQFGFTEYFGVQGLRETSRIWAEDVRERQIESEKVNNVWFRDDSFVVHFQEANVGEGTGRGITVYQISENSQSLIWMVRARRFEAGRGGWTLLDADVTNPDKYTTRHVPSLNLSLSQSLRAFTAVEKGEGPAQTPAWELARAIETLEMSGSNVEALRTELHAKVAYAFSILTMAFLALAVSTFRFNIYLNITVSLLVTFVFYGLIVVGSTMGKKGLLPPEVGAWMGNMVVVLASTSRLIWVGSKH
ncbi:LptF/LptG family permease [Desulfohalovibrio reitneri]|uniref:LptF/LptG family permease n=1 Tax=Desulfohalovibrio reitneri TaxID=1307759 RepID=UPI0004A7009E|nr:LptF/LptG family permease [Desulfohalovibrio reitneri]